MPQASQISASVGSSSTVPPRAGIHTTTGPVSSSGCADADLRQRRRGVGAAPLEERVRDPVAGQQAPYAVPAGRPPLGDDDDLALRAR